MLGVPTNQQQCPLGESRLLDAGSIYELQWESLKEPASLILSPETQDDFLNLNSKDEATKHLDPAHQL